MLPSHRVVWVIKYKIFTIVVNYFIIYVLIFQNSLCNIYSTKLTPHVSCFHLFVFWAVLKGKWMLSHYVKVLQRALWAIFVQNCCQYLFRRLSNLFKRLNHGQGCKLWSRLKSNTCYNCIVFIKTFFLHFCIEIFYKKAKNISPFIYSGVLVTLIQFSFPIALVFSFFS